MVLYPALSKHLELLGKCGEGETEWVSAAALHTSTRIFRRLFVDLNGGDVYS